MRHPPFRPLMKPVPAHPLLDRCRRALEPLRGPAQGPALLNDQPGELSLGLGCQVGVSMGNVRYECLLAIEMSVVTQSRYRRPSPFTSRHAVHNVPWELQLGHVPGSCRARTRSPAGSPLRGHSATEPAKSQPKKASLLGYPIARGGRECPRSVGKMSPGEPYTPGVQTFCQYQKVAWRLLSNGLSARASGGGISFVHE